MHSRKLVLALVVIMLTVGSLPVLSSRPASANGLPDGVPEGSVEAEVTGHDDGDKFSVEIDGERETVLLISADAPEEGECFADKASSRLKKLIPKGSTVYLEQDTDDRDGKDRLLRYVWLPRDDANARLIDERMVADGYSTFKGRDGNSKYDARLKKVEKKAKSEKRGLWEDCGGGHGPVQNEPVQDEPVQDEPVQDEPVQDEADSEEADSRCEPVAQEVVDAIATGILPETGATLRGTQAVRSGDYEKVWFVAADLEGPGLDGADQIGIWATNDIEIAGGGLIFSVDGIAKEFSDWGAGDTTDANITLNDDGASEAKACVRQALD